MPKYPALFLVVFFALFSSDAVAQPLVKPEFRGVWVATVDNIDWPERPTTNS